MSEEVEEKMQDYICPNCSSIANGNYCPHCGQETHLHKDTFWGMIKHFLAHYLHYDGKFWITLKTLLFHPGKLSLEYRAQHRQRYISPISLYIFVTIIFFLIYSIAVKKDNNRNGRENISVQIQQPQQDSLDIRNLDSTNAALVKQGLKPSKSIAIQKWILLHRKHKSDEEFHRDLRHSLPKVFFFMIPVFAMLLKIVFLRNKKYYFVDHAVFALHVHSFVFIVTLLYVLNPFRSIRHYIILLILFLWILYFVLALKKVYRTGWLRSIFTFIFVGLGYAVFLLITYILFALITVLV